MVENKRSNKRFHLPLIVKFRPASGSAAYSLGLTKNLSCEGLGMETRNFNFVPRDNLELELKLPQNATSVFLSGYVVWKKHHEQTSFAGIEFTVTDKDIHSDTMKKIAAYSNIPAGSFLPHKDSASVKKGAGQRSLSGKPEQVIESQKKPQRPGITKQYRKDKGECDVSFLLPREAAPHARNITIAGDFNNWDRGASPMKRLESGDFRITLTLPCDREYRYRYLIDGDRWENDWHADKYVRNDFGSDDSVVIV